MKMTRIKRHLYFYSKRYIYCTLVIFIIIMSLILILQNYPKEDKSFYERLKDDVIDICNDNPSLLIFDNYNIAILKMDTLYSKGEENNNPFLDPIYDNDFDQCAGYIIITKKNGKLDANMSHICDMLDY